MSAQDRRLQIETRCKKEKKKIAQFNIKLTQYYWIILITSFYINNNKKIVCNFNKYTV